MNRIAVTGAVGNLGFKLMMHLLSLDRVSQVIGLDSRLPALEQSEEWRKIPHASKGRFVTSDLTDAEDSRWHDVIANSEAVVHFAARNPFPEANWSESNASLDMTLNLGLAAVNAGVKRFVFVSSNHVMGGYLNEPLTSSLCVGGLGTHLDHAVGTRWNTGIREMDSTIYAVSKSSGERVCRALAGSSAGKTTFVCVRVGWCQPGENLKTTLSAAGTVTQPRGEGKLTAADEWFRNMWLSNRDFLQIFEKSLFAESTHWPHPCVVVNGVSNNSGMKWSLAEAQEYLDYQPLDDVNS